jgi:hypothetical protein
MTGKWTRELFKVSKVNDTVPVTYNLVDLNNEPIEGTFYAEELQKIDKSVLDEPFKIEKVIKKSKGKSLVKYLGYPDSFNQWIDSMSAFRFTLYSIMPFQKEFSYNPNPNYVLEYNNDKFKFNTNKFIVYVNQKENFVVDLMNIFTDYPLTFTSEAEFNTWRASCNMKYWQNQLNFAVYCATYGCGVSLYDHIVSFTSPILVSSLFQFHFYYQVRKILAEMKCAIPTNQNFNSTNNFIDMTEYTKICNEFNIDPNTDFRLKNRTK